jgi:hypothetical protein
MWFSFNEAKSPFKKGGISHTQFLIYHYPSFEKEGPGEIFAVAPLL